MRLASKFVLALMIGMVAVLSILCPLIIQRELRLIESSTRIELCTVGRSLRPHFVKTWKEDGKAAAVAMLTHDPAEDPPPPRVGIRWLAAGEIPQHAEATEADLVDRLAQGEEVFVPPAGDRDDILLYVPISTAGVPAGALELATSLRAEQEAVAHDTLEVLIYSGVAVGVIGVMGLALAGLLVGRPLEQLVDQARQAARGSKGSWFVGHQDDEIGELGRQMKSLDDRLVTTQGAVVAEHSAREETLDQLRHAERMATMGKLAAGIAHELGTPLNVVIGRAQLIASGKQVGEAARTSAAIVAAQGEKMAAIIRQLMGFSRRQVQPKSPADVVAIARQTITMLQPMASRQQVLLNLETPLPKARARVEVSQLEQALSNLITNSLQAMKHAGVVTVAIHEEQVTAPGEVTAAPGKYLRLEVIDQGEGIAPDVLPRIFDPFFTTKPAGEGTGLGLSLTYGIVHELGGWIQATSRPGRGSTFTIHLPLLPG